MTLHNLARSLSTRTASTFGIANSITRNRQFSTRGPVFDMSKAIIVTGATGTQGGAVIRSLVEANADFEIIAVSRDPSSNSAQRLAKQSPKIKVIAGNLEQAGEIFESAKKVTSLPIWGVYSVQTVMSSNPFDHPEVRQGTALIDAALKNNVEMFVYSSVERGENSYENPTIVPHFITKHQIEHHLVDSTKGTNMSYTILRPVAFMNNQQPGFMGRVFPTFWEMNLGSKPLQLIAASDIGHFGAQAFLHPAEYRNKGISLAGDELTLDQYRKIFKEKTGEDITLTYRFVAWLILLMSRDMRLMFRWFGTDGYSVDIQALRKEYPGLKSFGTWLEQDSAFRKAK